MNFTRQRGWRYDGRHNKTYSGTTGKDCPRTDGPTEQHTDDLTSNDVDPFREDSCPIASKGNRIGEKVGPDRSKTLNDTEECKSHPPVCGEVTFKDEIANIPSIPCSDLRDVSVRCHMARR